MAMYNVGDRVMVREDLEDGVVYDGICATYEMEFYGGDFVTITDVNGDAYYIDEDDGDHVWSESMFVDPKMPTMYVPGDKVVVVENLTDMPGFKMLSGPRQNGDRRVGIASEMVGFIGKTVTIAAIIDGEYRIKEDGLRWRWVDEMFSDRGEIIEVASDEETMSLLGVTIDGGAYDE